MNRCEELGASARERFTDGGLKGHHTGSGGCKEVEPKRQSIDLASIFPTPNTIAITDPIYRLPCITHKKVKRYYMLSLMLK